MLLLESGEEDRSMSFDSGYFMAYGFVKERMKKLMRVYVVLFLLLPTGHLLRCFVACDVCIM